MWSGCDTVLDCLTFSFFSRQSAKEQPPTAHSCLLAMVFFLEGECGVSALCVPCEELSDLEVVYFFFFCCCCCCPHIKMKGLNEDVRRTRLVIPLKTRPRREVGGGARSFVFLLYIFVVSYANTRCCLSMQLSFVSGDLCRDSSFSGGFLGNKRSSSSWALCFFVFLIWLRESGEFLKKWKSVHNHSFAEANLTWLAPS